MELQLRTREMHDVREREEREAGIVEIVRHTR
jgi:hypothetical protein